MNIYKRDDYYCDIPIRNRWHAVKTVLRSPEDIMFWAAFASAMIIDAIIITLAIWGWA